MLLLYFPCYIYCSSVFKTCAFLLSHVYQLSTMLILTGKNCFTVFWIRALPLTLNPWLLPSFSVLACPFKLAWFRVIWEKYDCSERGLQMHLFDSCLLVISSGACCLSPCFLRFLNRFNGGFGERLLKINVWINNSVVIYRSASSKRSREHSNALSMLFYTSSWFFYYRIQAFRPVVPCSFPEYMWFLLVLFLFI